MRRECLDHVVVMGERHLLGVLSKYVDYYNGTRTCQRSPIESHSGSPIESQCGGVTGPQT